jgi:MoaA/NifB/PqqE/SkfB family radical SAM enzyme
VEEPRFRPNQFRHATSIETPAIYRDGRWHTFEPRPAVARELRGRTWWLRPGLTFTPYANPTRCNAHCAFCSEELQRRDADRLTAETIIGDRDRYFARLDRAWRELAGFPMGMSLSGLEATSDPAWLLRLLSLIEQHDALFPEKVLYTNGSGLCTHDELIEALGHARFDRIELSRCHFDEAINQRIMRFDRNQPVYRHEAFVDTVRRARRRVPVKLSCILNRQGVCAVPHLEEYLREAAALGVDRVVFRELSVLGDSYLENREQRWITGHRASVRALLDEIHPDRGALREGWEFLGVTSGYYYYNEVYRHRGVEVTLEGSSYVAHHEIQKTGVLQKLVFHSTGDLCGDWVPSSLVIGNYFDPDP